MRILPTAALAAALIMSTPVTAKDPTADQVVRQVEDAWSQAFVSGDTAFLSELLDPGYVSVSASGTARSREQVIDLARRYAEKSPGQKAQPLPPSSKIQVHGGLALVTHHGPNEVSVDVLHLSNGAWRALYSQHTAIGK